MSTTKVVLYFRIHEVRWSIPDQELHALHERFPGAEIVSVENDPELPRELADADVFCGWHFPPEQFSVARRLRWVHSASAGIEANLFPSLVESDVQLTNATGQHSVSIPEHVLGMMIALARNFHQAQRAKQARRWDRFGVISYAGGIRELKASNLAILGAGPIGLGLARMARALGMHIRIMRRRPDLPIAEAEQIVGPDKLHDLLAWADFVVIATPLTAETRHLIDAAALEAMKSSAFLINIGRGESVDDQALIQALRDGAIAGAGLDVFSEEPLPSSSPYFELDNVILTPHVSGYTADYFKTMVERFADNLERFVAGSPLKNVVNKRLGYVDSP